MYIALNLLKKHEGFRQFPYKCTSNKLTIGYGLNLEDRGITKSEAEFILKNSISGIDDQLRKMVKNLYTLSPVRIAVLIDIAYAVGISGFSKFKKLISAVEEKNFEKAADEILDSEFYRNLVSVTGKTDNRAKELSDMMRLNRIL